MVLGDAIESKNSLGEPVIERQKISRLNRTHGAPLDIFVYDYYPCILQCSIIVFHLAATDQSL